MMRTRGRQDWWVRLALRRENNFSLLQSLGFGLRRTGSQCRLMGSNQAMTALAVFTTLSTVRPNCSKRISAGALAPKWSRPMQAPWVPV